MKIYTIIIITCYIWTRKATAHKVTHNLLELTQVVGLDSPDLLVTDAPDEVVTQGLVRAMCRTCDLHVARDNWCPELLGND